MNDTVNKVWNGCLMVFGGGIGVLLLLALVINNPILLPVFALVGYAGYRYGIPYLKQQRIDREHRDAVERRRLSDEADRTREVEDKVERHRNGLRLLAMFAMTDERLSRIEADILEGYLRSAPYPYVSDIKLWIKTGVPSTNERERLTRTILRTMDPQQLRSLGEHLRMMRGIKRRHAPLVEEWFDEAYRHLGMTPSAPDPHDISPI